MKNTKAKIATGVTVVLLGGLGGLALSQGKQAPSKPVADKPVVHTRVIRRTIHVTKHAKPKHPPAGAPVEPASGAGSSTTAPVVTGSSSGGAAEAAPVATGASGTGGSGGSAPVSTGASGTGGGESAPVSTGSSGAAGGGGGEVEHEGGGGGDD